MEGGGMGVDARADWVYFTSPDVVVAVVVGVEEGGGGEDGRLHGWTRCTRCLGSSLGRPGLSGCFLDGGPGSSVGWAG